MLPGCFGGLDAKIVDVETTFLYRKLEEEVYMKQKDIHHDDEVLFLQHNIFGPSYQYFKYFISKLRNGGDRDPCLMTQQDKHGIVWIAIWVDDSCLIGNMTAFDATIRELRKEGFNLKIKGSLDDYLSCEITILDDNSMGWIHQSHLINKIKKKSGILVNIQMYKTPSMPGLNIPRKPETKIDAEKQSMYHTGVGNRRSPSILKKLVL